jgi:hypothetical protein
MHRSILLHFLVSLMIHHIPFIGLRSIKMGVNFVALMEAKPNNQYRINNWLRPDRPSPIHIHPHRDPSCLRHYLVQACLVLRPLAGDLLTADYPRSPASRSSRRGGHVDSWRSIGLFLCLKALGEWQDRGRRFHPSAVCVD